MFDRYAAIGDLLWRHGLITERQLRKGVSLQGKERLKGQYRKLGEILVTEGFCTEAQVDLLLHEQASYRSVAISPALDELERRIEDQEKATKALQNVCEEMTKMG